MTSLSGTSEQHYTAKQVSSLRATTHKRDNDTPLQPQSER
nr:MAG TPA: hypothetical protein [Caudoviricetes sp.]